MSRKRKHRRANARADRLRDGGPDETGRYGVNPYAARGHVVEVAPKELRSSSTSDQFPKRVITQRMLDRYRAHGHISLEQWRAGNALWEFHVEKDRVARTTSGYDPVMVQSSPSIDGRLAKYLDAALGFTRLMSAVPYRLRGVVEAVVIDDRSASGWARSRRLGRADAERHGMACLRSGLSALVEKLGIDNRGG